MKTKPEKTKRLHQVYFEIELRSDNHIHKNCEKN